MYVYVSRCICCVDILTSWVFQHINCYKEMMLDRKSLWENFCTQAFSFIGCIRDRLHLLCVMCWIYVFDKDVSKRSEWAKRHIQLYGNCVNLAQPLTLECTFTNEALGNEIDLFVQIGLKWFQKLFFISIPLYVYPHYFGSQQVRCH